MKVLQNWGFGTNKKGQSSRGFDSNLCRCLFEKIAISIFNINIKFLGPNPSFRLQTLTYCIRQGLFVNNVMLI